MIDIIENERNVSRALNELGGEMKEWQKMLVSPEATIIEALKIIDVTGQQAAFVVSPENLLLGSVTDGDVRRALLNQVELSSPVSRVMNKEPLTARSTDSKEKILAMMRGSTRKAIPVIGENEILVGIETLYNFFKEDTYPNQVVLMAGGLGSRLYPLTKDCPKPLLKVGDKPIIEVIVDQFLNCGFSKFFVSVNYKADMLKEYLGDGERWGCSISYLEEKDKLGTAGSLTLLPSRPDEPIIVMNGDLLTKINFNQLLEFHKNSGAIATMCVREYDFQVPYGVVSVEDEAIESIDEKPIHNFFVNGGIYVLNPEILDLIPQKAHFDMPSLFQLALKKGLKTSAFPLREYWLDIGQTSDYERAHYDYEKYFS